jgi:phthiocerol/phenolphthiocerol synthesis type-I polyketide synthase E
MDELSQDGSVAIIGMAGRFPGAPNIDRFWEILRDGREAVTFYSDDELLQAGVVRTELDDPHYVKAAPRLENAVHFDREYFGYSPREAELIDPQQRIFLECCVEALENASCNPDEFDGSIGVFGGCALNVYQYSLIESLAGDLRSSGSLQAMFTHGNDKDFLTTRVSYKLNLRGPSVAVQTACSTSLVAVHFAVQSIISGECDVALAGGASITRSYEKAGYGFVEGGIFSRDGHTRPFDSRASGTVFGDGVGVIVLKGLKQALKDGDNIRAIIRGSAINNDGAAKVGYSAPSVGGQASVISEALEMAGVPHTAINYIEAHGTATRLGDAIEVAALNKVFDAGSAGAPCGLGTVKSNIGHLNTAAGIAGLIKTVLALENELLPATINFDSLNPNIDLENSPFYVVTKATSWPKGTSPRLAGVSSFGIGGTNAHIVLEEAPAVLRSSQTKSDHVILLSAKQPRALEAMTANLARYLEQNPETNIGDVAYTCATGRMVHRYRRAIVCSDAQDAKCVLRGGDATRMHSAIHGGDKKPVVFMFPGQGSQYFDMGRQLYDSYPAFRREIDKCLELARTFGMTALHDILLPRPGTEPQVANLLVRTEFAQPAIFIVSYALARLWMSLGIVPKAMIGHSLGEIVAACVAGVFSVEDALLMVLARGEIMQSMPEGGMLAIQAPLAEIEMLLERNHSIAALNGPRACVISGPWESIGRLESTLGSRGIPASRLRTSHAFHSTMMEPAVNPFLEKLSRIRLDRPKIPFVSSVTGTWIQENQATDLGYWGRQLVATVRFAHGLTTILESGESIMIEVGPGHILSNLVSRYLDEPLDAIDARNIVVLPSVSAHGRQINDGRVFLSSCGQAWLHGAPVDWSGLYRGINRRKLPLPPYPFERRAYSPSYLPRPLEVASRRQPSISSTVSTLAWVRSNPTTQRLQNQWQAVLFFANRDSFSAEMIERLRTTAKAVILVYPGDDWELYDPTTVVVSPGTADHFDLLREHLTSLNIVPDLVIYAWTILPRDIDENLPVTPLERTFYGLTYLIRAFGKHPASHEVEIAIVAAGTQKVTGSEPITPIAATALGPYLAAPIEYEHLFCRFIDVSHNELSGTKVPILVDCIIRELNDQSSTQMVAYRGLDRWVPILQEVVQPDETSNNHSLRQTPVYLITGGLGALGIAIAKSIARQTKSSFILISRSHMPPRNEWKRVLAAGPEKIARAIRAIEDIESCGSEVLVEAADISDLSQMETVVDRARARFGAIHNVIHAAGVPGVGLMASRTKDDMDRVLAPKINGTVVLSTIFHDQELDLLILFSSVNSLFHGAGRVDYAAANAYLDAFGRSESSCAKRIITINWDRWGEIGMAVDLMSAVTNESSSAPWRIDALSTAQGLEAFHSIVASECSQALVSNQIERFTAKLATGLPRLASSYNTGRLGSNLGLDECPRHQPRPSLGTEYVAPKSELESIIAKFWSDLFKISPIGVDDDFFELGGHSLLALQLIPILRNRFDVPIEAQDVFRTTTVAGIASIIEMKLIEEIVQEHEP